VTGLPGAGKSTFGARLAAALRARGTPCAMLDGDEVRSALGRPAGAGPAERDGFYAALAGLAALLARQGVTAVVASTAHRAVHRDQARALAPRFVEVYVATSLDECRQRDPRGLYRRALAGEAHDVPGIDATYELPSAPDVVATGGEDAAALERALEFVASEG
jgi:adenylylsulfate kinase